MRKVFPFSLGFKSPKGPLFIQFLPYLYERVKLFVLFFFCNDDFSVIITFNLCGGFPLSCSHFLEMGRLTSDLELIGDIVIMIETSCLSSFEPRS